jgi:MFS family permease
VTSLWLGLTSGMTEFVVASLLSGVGTGLMSPAVNASVTDVIARGRDVNGGSALAGF